MRALTIVALTMCFCGPANAQPLNVRESNSGTVAETMERLVSAIEGKGLKVAARVDHAAGAKAAGLEMPPTQVVIFGNPKLGTPLMLANPELAVDLPLKIVVWQAANSKVMIGYTAPGSLMVRFGIKEQDAVFKSMGEALDAFAVAAAGP